MHNCFALDQYEAYQTIMARPQVVEGDWRHDSFQSIKLKWRDLEPERSHYQLDRIEANIAKAQQPYIVLMIEPDLPNWIASERKSEQYAALIRKVGSVFGSDTRMFAVVATMLEDTIEEWEAYIDSFQAPYLLADVRNAAFIRYLRAQQHAFGLWLTAEESNWLEYSEQIAKLRLGSIWKQQPVLLAVPDLKLGEGLRNEARRWHVALSNIAGPFGARLALRRVAFPVVAYTGKHFPLRLWFVNDGTCKFYRPFKLWLRLQNEQQQIELELGADTSTWLTGDLVHNEIVLLPDMPAGAYQLAIGVKYENGETLKLAIQGQGEDGFYEAGLTTMMCTDGDPYQEIWKSYYPEGYYPLEDPQVPE